MLVETAPLETGHGARHTVLIGSLTGLQLDKAHGAQTRMAMQAQRVGRARLTIAQPGELGRLRQQKFYDMS